VQSWSDHCCQHYLEKPGLLKKLSEATARIHHPLVVSAFTDNAGGMEFLRGLVCDDQKAKRTIPELYRSIRRGCHQTRRGDSGHTWIRKGGLPDRGTTVMGTWTRAWLKNVPPALCTPQLIVTEAIRATAYYTNPMVSP